jgi:hypothetical protein
MRSSAPRRTFGAEVASCRGRLMSEPSTSTQEEKFRADLPSLLHRLQLARRPNPPALFARLREYSLLAAQRVELFARLRDGLSDVMVESSAAGNVSSAQEDNSVEAPTTLVFANTSCVAVSSRSYHPFSRALTPSLYLADARFPFA